MEISIKNQLRLIKVFYMLKRMPPTDNIMIFSDPRGGSTWLLELLLQIPYTTTLWEPFHVNNGIVPASLNLGWRPFVAEFEVRKDIYNLFTKLLTGRLINEWVNYGTTIQQSFYTKQFIIKNVRLNSMLPWLTKNFNFKHKPIYLLRHPMAVALSQLKAFKKEEKFEPYPVPKVVRDDVYSQRELYLSTLTTKLEQQIAEWCLHNVDTIKHARAMKDWHLVYYENLLIEPEKELESIFSALKINMPKQILAKFTL